MKHSNEFNKKALLVEQEAESIRSENTKIKEILHRKDMEISDFGK